MKIKKKSIQRIQRKINIEMKMLQRKKQLKMMT